MDAVARNLRLGRLLLLVVGDGIRESVETLVNYLQGHAGFHFTLGIVEFAVHRMPEAGGFVVQPRVLARTVNVERSIVRIEEGRPVVQALPPSPSKRSGQRTSITEEHLLESLRAIETSLPDRLRAFLDGAAAYGVTYDLNGSLMLRWRDSRGIKFNLGCIYPNGDVRTDPVNWRANDIGELDLAHRYLKRLATSIQGMVRRSEQPTAWYVTTDGKKLPTITQLLDASDEWFAAIEEYTNCLTEVAKVRQRDHEA